jgi:ABC-type dipeptide/oligopeptide/nickel transport system permease component
MMGYLIRRILLAIPTLFVMLTAIFVLVRLVPGDAASVILGDQASAASLEALRAKLGLDQPLLVQYLSFLGDVLTGNLGQSLSSGRSVIQEVLLVLPSTIELTLSAIIIGLVFGLPLGIAAALTRNGWVDYVSRIVSLVGLSFPAFVSGILMLIVFAIQLGWFPVLGTVSGGGASFGQRLQALALPALNLGIIMTAYVMRVTRASMLGVLTEDYIRTARAKGVAPRNLVMTHALRNSLIPIITVVGLYFGTLIGNSVLTEIIFNRPGLGKLILSALNARDYTLLQGLMIIFAICVIIVNTLTDMAYGLVDPRVKYS